jgi:mono/diheme cytochrome c family protein
MIAFGRPAAFLVASILAVSAASTLTWTLSSARKSSAEVELGRALYAEHCASCHGANLEGEPDWQSPKPNGRMPAPPHDASGHTWHHADRILHQITKRGMSAVVPNYESDMRAFEGVLRDEEINAILAFIKGTWPARERAYQREQNRNDKGESP